jgi:hypothetical protein
LNEWIAESDYDCSTNDGVRGGVESIGETWLLDTVDVVVSNCTLNLDKPEDGQNNFCRKFSSIKTRWAGDFGLLCDELPTQRRLWMIRILRAGISGHFRNWIFRNVWSSDSNFRIEICATGGTLAGDWCVGVSIVYGNGLTKASRGECWEHHQVNFVTSKSVDDDGHTLVRGCRMAVCEKCALNGWLGLNRMRSKLRNRRERVGECV